MTQANFGFILFILIIFGGFTAYVWFVPYKRERLKHQRYRLFAVRDEWAYLVPSGVIQKDDPLFQTYFDLITSMLRATDKLTLRRFVIALESELTPEHKELERQMVELARRSPAALNVMENLYHAVIDILVENSFILRVAIRLHRFGNYFTKLVSIIRRWCADSTPIKAYDSVVYCQTAVAVVIDARSSAISSPWII